MNLYDIPFFDDIDTSVPEVVEPPPVQMQMPNPCRPAAEIEPFRFRVSDHEDLKDDPHDFAWFLDADQVWHLYSETEFTPPEWVVPDADWEAVWREETECPWCHGKGILTPLRVGKTTGIRVIDGSGYRCLCCKYVNYNRFVARTVPERFRSADLDTIAPSAKVAMPKAEQQRIIDLVKAHREDSFLLLGDAGTGKTHLAVALMLAARRRYADLCWESPRLYDDACHEPIWRVTTRVLLDEFVEWENRDRHNENCSVKAPTVTIGRITSAQQSGIRPCLLLDEIDDFKPTDFKLSTLRSLIDAIYTGGGQVIATSNRPPAWFKAQWGEQVAESVMRRIGQENGHLIVFRKSAAHTNPKHPGGK